VNLIITVDVERQRCRDESVASDWGVPNATASQQNQWC